MTDKDGIARSDLERLSAYLDGELNTSEAERLEARLATDGNLSRTLEALRATSTALGNLPEVSPPRSFALTEEMVQPRRAYPILQLSTAVAALSFILVVGADLFLSSARGAALEAPQPALIAADQIAEEQAAEPEALEVTAGEMEDEFAAAPAAEEGTAATELERTAAPAAEEADAVEGEAASAPEPAEDAAEDSERALAGAAEPEAEGEGEVADPEFYKQESELPEEQVGELGLEEEAAEGADNGALALEEQPPALDELTFEQDAMLDEAVSEPGQVEGAPSATLDLLRTVEIGLGAVLIGLIALTLWVRQRA